MQQFAAVRTREIYRSPNGDRWLLARDPDIGRVFVRHEPNLPSGGQVADIEIGAFLIAAGNGPEKQELLRLVGTLAYEPPRGPSVFYGRFGRSSEGPVNFKDSTTLWGRLQNTLPTSSHDESAISRWKESVIPCDCTIGRLWS
jgi:hypothetical protein